MDYSYVLAIVIIVLSCLIAIIIGILIVKQMTREDETQKRIEQIRKEEFDARTRIDRGDD